MCATQEAFSEVQVNPNFRNTIRHCGIKDGRGTISVILQFRQVINVKICSELKSTVEDLVLDIYNSGGSWITAVQR